MSRLKATYTSDERLNVIEDKKKIENMLNMNNLLHLLTCFQTSDSFLI